MRLFTITAAGLCALAWAGAAQAGAGVRRRRRRLLRRGRPSEANRVVVASEERPRPRSPRVVDSGAPR